MNIIIRNIIYKCLLLIIMNTSISNIKNNLNNIQNYLLNSNDNKINDIINYQLENIHDDVKHINKIITCENLTDENSTDEDLITYKIMNKFLPYMIYYRFCILDEN